MFDSHAAARETLQSQFDPAQVERLVASLVPAILFAPLPGTNTLGATKLGGMPDLPASTEWPRPSPPADVEVIARRGNADAGAHMRRHMELGLPYAFIAQVDLAEAAALGAVGSSLPPDGRLLFFYDIAVGPWDTDSRVARVIWDRSPPDDLARTAMPPDLAEAAARERAEAAGIAAKYGTGASPDEERTIYDAPERAAQLKTTLRLPHSHALDIAALPEIQTIYNGDAVDGDAEAFVAAYREALDEYQDDYPDDPWHHQQLLGSPLPVQDDPRYAAVIVTTFHKQHLSREEWQANRAEIEAQAHDWLSLLQIELSAWGLEGTVYFVMRGADLAERRFDRVVAVYQQT